MPVVDMREAAPLVIGATGLDAVVQNIRMILTTFAYPSRWTGVSPRTAALSTPRPR